MSAQRPYSLEAHLRAVIPENTSGQEHKLFNARVIFQACNKLLAELARHPESNYHRAITLEIQDKNQKKLPIDLDIDIEKRAGKLKCKLQVKDIDENALCTRVWETDNPPLELLGTETYIVTSDIKSTSEGLGLGIALMTCNELIAPALIASQRTFFKDAPTATFVIIDQAYSRENNERSQWSATQAKALGYLPLPNSSSSYYKVYPTSP